MQKRGRSRVEASALYEEASETISNIKHENVGLRRLDGNVMGLDQNDGTALAEG